MTPRTISDAIARSVRAALVQVPSVPASEIGHLARAIGNNAAAALQADPVAALLAAVSAIGADLKSVGVYLREGGATVQIVVASAADVAPLGAMLGCGEPRLVGNGRDQWLAAELGDYEAALIVSVIGGHRPVCQCDAAVAARSAG